MNKFFKFFPIWLLVITLVYFCVFTGVFIYCTVFINRDRNLDDFYKQTERGAVVLKVINEELAVVKSDSTWVYAFYDRRVKRGDSVLIKLQGEQWYIDKKVKRYIDGKVKR